MIVALDITPLESGHAGRGVGVSVRVLLESLIQYFPDVKIITFTGDNIPVNCDIVHYPYFDPFFLTLPFAKPKPTVVTVHDLTPVVFPAHFPKGIRGMVKWQMQKLSLRGAKHIITDSDSSRQDIIRFTAIAKDHISRVYLAPDPQYQPVKNTDVVNAVCQKYQINQPYILYVGDINWNKNISGLIAAYGMIRQKYSKTVLVLAGKAFKSEIPEARAIKDQIRALNLENQVILPGYIPDVDLKAIYSGTRCLAMPSHYEGFGLPVLEAMACGSPVVVGDNSSLQEIKGPGIAVDSYNPKSIAQGLDRILVMSPSARQELIKSQFAWVNRFTWRKTAGETVAVYENVVGYKL